MSRHLRRPTTETIGLPGALAFFREGRPPISAADQVEACFGPEGERGCLVISGANGIVGAGKTMQLGARLEPFGVRVAALDLPSAPDGIGRHYAGLKRAFGAERADRIMAGVVRLSYDGRRLPDDLARLRPRFLLEAIPEVLDLKKAHYEAFRAAYPGITIRSVTSGFPSAALGVGIAHPAFPHEINRVWETVEEDAAPVGKLLWSLGLVPVPVSDDWSFVLDVLFCGVTLAGTRVAERTNMPFWKIDKLIRRAIGPNPFRAHDAIGAKGANFLTWSCLHHLAERYGALFAPTASLLARRASGANWYPPDHARPVVGWPVDAEIEEEFRTLLLGPLYQMTSLLLHEKRSHPAQINMMGELCAQFRRGALALLRERGAAEAVRVVEAFHARCPEAARAAWHPEAFEALATPEFQQLYVNAEHDGEVGVLTLGRESYNRDVDAELNRAIDWLRREGIERVILSGDFHLTTQHVGADTSEFFPALEKEEEGVRIAAGWSATARRLHDDFRHSVGVIHGKRCLGGMLELMLHCHVVVAEKDAALGFPEVTLPVVPGMEGCHWPMRRTDAAGRARLLGLLLGGAPVRAAEATGWLIDSAGSLDETLAAAWRTAKGAKGGLAPRPVETGAVGVPDVPADLPKGEGATEKARRAIMECVRAACAAPFAGAIDVQARHSARFMLSPECRRGSVGAERDRVEKV